MFGYTESPRTLSNISHKFFTRSNLQNLRKRTPGLYFFQRAHLVSGRSTAFMLSNWATFAVTCVVAGPGGPAGWPPTAAQAAGRAARSRRSGHLQPDSRETPSTQPIRAAPP